MPSCLDRDALLRHPRYRSRVLRAFPELRVDPLPPLDVVVVAYLAKHDVFVKPVGSNISPAALTSGALAGAVGPGWAMANAHITQQKNASALQEWTSWKQWALSQPDFAEFKATVASEQERATRRSDELWADPSTQAEVRELIEAADKQSAKENAKAAVIVWTGIGLFVAAGALMTYFDRNYSPEQPPVTTAPPLPQCQPDPASGDKYYYAPPDCAP